VGLRTRVEVRAPLPGGSEELAAAFDAAAAVLIARGLVLVESGVPGTLLGQRDGVTVTIGSDGDALELDAITGCRPR
jgi:6-phosphogluconate dehydrogenase (decarboxylating)